MFRDVVEHVLRRRTSADMVKFLQKLEGKSSIDTAEDELYPKYVMKWCNVYGADSGNGVISDNYFTY